MKKAKDQPGSEPAELASLVGERIRKIRKEEGLSLELFALRCDMNAAYVGHIERDVQNPTLNTLERICKGLDISVEDLFIDMLFTDVQRSVRLNKKKKSTNTSPYPDEVIDRLARAFYPAILACWNSEEGQREFAAWQAVNDFIGIRGSVCGLFLFVQTHAPLIVPPQQSRARKSKFQFLSGARARMLSALHLRLGAR